MRRRRNAAAAAALALCAAGPVAAQSNATPTQAETNAARRSGPCTDPWVTIALTRVYFGARPERCAIGLYNGGQWNSFAELYDAVRATDALLKSQSAELRITPVIGQGGGYNVVAVFVNAKIVAAGGGNMVAAGGGNLRSAVSGQLKTNGSQMVAAGGGNMVAAGGGNLVDVPVAQLNGGRSLLSGSTIRLPKGRIGVQ